MNLESGGALYRRKYHFAADEGLARSQVKRTVGRTIALVIATALLGSCSMGKPSRTVNHSQLGN